MTYRRFGNTDMEVSAIGFGSWAIGGAAMIGETAIGWGEADDMQSVRAIHAALDAGINFFDTADIYGLGHSENLLGKTIGKQKEIFIATKGGNVSRNGQFTSDYSANHLIKACEDSLRRLKREAIDYYQLHSARLQHLLEGECIEAMHQLRQQGKIRYWGLSLNTFQPLPEAEYLIGIKEGDGFQLVFNLLNRRAGSLLKKAVLNGYGLIARMPLQFGLLTGKFDTEFSFEESDHRKKRVTKELVDISNNALMEVWQLCRKYDCNKTKLALSYVLNQPEISTVISGIRSTDHVDSNTKGLFTIDEKDMKMIEELDLEEVMGVIEKNG
jgi:aryl-alcohol dehydrogenase-like predicted oxidoreductase